MPFLQRLAAVAATAAALNVAFGIALAQPAAKSRTAPAPSAPVYRSAFDSYRPWRADEPSADWRQANQEMGQLGGHAGHLRGAPPSPSTSSSTTKPSPKPSGGDAMHDAHRNMHGGAAPKKKEPAQ
jgi:hypothetical protein